MENTITENETQLREILLSGPLQQIKFYQVNNNFFQLEKEGFWIIDCGIELKFESGYVSATWDPDRDSFIISNDSVKNIYKDQNFIELKNDTIEKLNKLVGLNIKNADFKSSEFQYIVDYTMRTETETLFVELIIEFENTSKIQVAFVDYALHENKAPNNFSYNVNSGLLVSTKTVMEIKEPED